MRQRELFIDWLKALAIFLVIAFHVAYGINQNNSLRIIGFFGVSLFFIISGFILAKNYPEQKNFSLQWFKKRYIKIATLYYPSLILIVLLFSKQVYSGNIFKNLISHFLFIDSNFPNYTYGIISPAWFLAPLILFYLFFPFLNRLIRKSEFFLIPIFLITTLFRIHDGNYTSTDPLFFLGEFCFGIAIANKKFTLPLISSIMVMLISPSMVLPFVIFILFYFARTKTTSNPLIKFISNETLALFLFHEGLINLALNKWHIYFIPKYYSIPIYIILVAILTYFSDKFYKKIYRDKKRIV